MKLILSRKGFDSGSGGCASPIFEDGSITSIQIPDRRGRFSYGEIGHGGLLGRVVSGLSRGEVHASTCAHLDPDLEHASVPRLPGWRGSLGQTGSARSHLVSQGVGPGDVFLFFGWFRDALEDASGTWRFAPRGRSVHALFGWLQVGEVVPMPTGSETEWSAYQWLRDHPHVGRGSEPRNQEYLRNGRPSVRGLQKC